MKFLNPFYNLLKMLYMAFITGIFINSNNEKMNRYLDEIEKNLNRIKEITIFKERV